jgi:hypothetical protein
MLDIAFVLIFVQCDFKTAHGSYLAQHKKIHTGVKSFACKHPNCETTWFSASDLNKHMRFHTGERRFLCDQCPATFVVSGHLTGFASHNEFVVYTKLFRLLLYCQCTSERILASVRMHALSATRASFRDRTCELIFVCTAARNPTNAPSTAATRPSPSRARCRCTQKRSIQLQLRNKNMAHCVGE